MSTGRMDDATATTRTGGTSFGFRTDIGTLRPPRKLADGRLVADAHITKPGIFEYADDGYPNGIRRELRDDAEVFAKDSLDSFALAPVTNEHPPVMIDAKNAKKYMVGSVGEHVTRDDGHVKATVMVADATTIAKLEKGDVEVSCGYACEVDETPGVHPVYGKYDAVQKNIRGNHLAVAVGLARAGRTARVRMDAELNAAERDKLRASQFAVPDKGKLPIHDADHVRAAMSRFSDTEGLSADERKEAVSKIAAAAKRFGIDASGFVSKYGGEDKNDSRQTHVGGGSMDPTLQERHDADLRALGVSRDNEKQRADAAEADAKTWKSRAEQAEGKLTALQSRFDQQTSELAEARTAAETAEIQKLRARCDAAELAVSRFDETMATKVRGRAKLERQATIVLGNEFRMDDLSNRQIRVAAIKRMDSTVDVSESVPKDTIKGLFDMLIGQRVKHADSMASTAQVLAETHRERPRQDMHDEQEDIARNAWKHPLKITRYSDAKRS